MGSKDDILKYPVYKYEFGELIKLDKPPVTWNIWQYQCHHYIKQQTIRRHPELSKFQKLFILPTQMHIDLHNCHRDFENKWGIKREVLLYGAKF